MTNYSDDQKKAIEFAEESGVHEIEPKEHVTPINNDLYGDIIVNPNSEQAKKQAQFSKGFSDLEKELRKHKLVRKE